MYESLKKRFLTGFMNFSQLVRFKEKGALTQEEFDDIVLAKAEQDGIDPEEVR